MGKAIVLTKTAFVRHPVLPELKRRLNSEGFQIVDATFAPEGAERRAQRPSRRCRRKS